MKRYVVSFLAETDLAEIHSYIASDRPSAADSVLETFFRAFDTLANQSSLGEQRDDLMAGLRVFAIKNYVVCYSEMEDGIQVARVLHGARDIAALFSGPQRQ
jgi:toxin ParE1/3/4